MKFGHPINDERGHFRLKARNVKAPDLGTDPSWGEPRFHRFKHAHSFHERIHRLLGEKHAGARLRYNRIAGKEALHGLQHASATVSNHWPTIRVSLDGDNTEIFLAGKEHRPAVGVVLAERCFGQEAEEFNTRPGEAAQPPVLGAVTDYPQRAS